MTADQPLPSILWVASRAPIPPFDGPTLKAYSGITSLMPLADIHLLTFAEPDRRDDVTRRLREYWTSPAAALSDVKVLDYGPPSGMALSLLRRRFLFGSRVNIPSLTHRVDAVLKQHSERLLVLDDFVFAPLASRYGRRALFSPHDCLSALLRSSARNAPGHAQALKAWTQSRIALDYERRFYHRFLLTHLVTHRDRFLLQRINGRARYHVVPNSPLRGPLTARPDRYDWDVLLWADLRHPPALQGVRLFLRALRTDATRPFQVVVVGRVPPKEAARLIGMDLRELVVYQSFLEDDAGRIRHAKVTVIPDIGGAGIKNRALNILAAHKCLACVYSQMDGLETFCDAGAINAFTMPELFQEVKRALDAGSYAEKAAVGGTLYEREFAVTRQQEAWASLIRRTVAIRDAESTLDL